MVAGGVEYGAIDKYWTCRCSRCGQYSLWVDGTLVFPAVKTAAAPNRDLPADIAADHEEARSILTPSPRGAAALLRLCIQKLCKHLGEPRVQATLSRAPDPQGRAPVNAMLDSYRCLIKGVPYAQDKVRGNVGAPEEWTKAVVDETEPLPKVHGPCLVRVTFRLPPEKFPADHPYGNDIDNLLKRFFDALNQTVFSEAPGRDGCVVAVEAAKVRVADRAAAGAEMEIISLSRA
jgi:hypothetical protein